MTSSTAELLCRRFSLAEIRSATEDFSDAHVIGSGGFGKVYRALIDNGSLTVASKRLAPNSNQGATEFAAEVETLTKVRHRNLVAFIGYCDEEGEKILVYEYMSNGTLDDHLYRKSSGGGYCSSLTWTDRLRICIGAGQGLGYLHTGCSIIHRDVKPTNILLDADFTAKVSDFGLAKHLSLGTWESHVSTGLKGTLGYCDPSYFRSGRLTRASDTYAFGVVLLEVLTGKRPNDPRLAEEGKIMNFWAQEKIKNGKASQIVASDLKGEISEGCLKSFVAVVMRCLCDEPKKRLTMSQVVAQLEFALEIQETRGARTRRLQLGPLSAFWNRVKPSGSKSEENEIGVDELPQASPVALVAEEEDGLEYKREVDELEIEKNVSVLSVEDEDEDEDGIVNTRTADELENKELVRRWGMLKLIVDEKEKEQNVSMLPVEKEEVELEYTRTLDESDNEDNDTRLAFRDESDDDSRLAFRDESDDDSRLAFRDESDDDSRLSFREEEEVVVVAAEAKTKAKAAATKEEEEEEEEATEEEEEATEEEEEVVAEAKAKAAATEEEEVVAEAKAKAAATEEEEEVVAKAKSKAKAAATEEEEEEEEVVAEAKAKAAVTEEEEEVAEAKAKAAAKEEEEEEVVAEAEAKAKAKAAECKAKEKTEVRATEEEEEEEEDDIFELEKERWDEERIQYIEAVNDLERERWIEEGLGYKEPDELEMERQIGEDAFKYTQANDTSAENVSMMPIAVPASEMFTVTDEFSRKCWIANGSNGGGIFIGVFKTGDDAAIKRLYNKLPDREFLQQVSTIFRLKHENVVKLHGYCADAGLQVLMYEFAPRRSLHDILQGTQGDEGLIFEPGWGLSWPQRIKVAIGAAKGLHYIHKNRLIHRNIKSSNVLIFGDEVAKISDLHLSTRCACNKSYIDRRRPFAPAPCSAYHPPEFWYTGSGHSQKGDVYSFGVLLLELLTGRDASRKHSSAVEDLVEWATPMLSEDKVENIVDARLKGAYPLKAAAKVASVAGYCLAEKPRHRPSMIIVLRGLLIASLWTRRSMKQEYRPPAPGGGPISPDARLARASCINEILFLFFSVFVFALSYSDYITRVELESRGDTI